MRGFIFITTALTPAIDCNQQEGLSRSIACCSPSALKRSNIVTFGSSRRPFISSALLSATIQENKEQDSEKLDDDNDDDNDNDGMDNGADGDDDDDDDDYDIDVDSVSDAEALLACRSYLQRRNRLGQWTQFEKRRVKRRGSSSNNHQQQQQSLLSSASAMSSSTQYGDKGFFWDNPAELKYLYKKKEYNNMPAFSSNNSNDSSATAEPLVIMTGKDGVEDNDDNSDSDNTLTLRKEDDEFLDDYDFDDNGDDDNNSDEDDAMWETVRPQVSEHRTLSTTEQKRSQKRQEPTLLFWEDHDDDEDNVLGETSQDFAVFDGTPSPEHVRRSRAAKRTWSDPEWRAQWQEKRWGTSTSRHLSLQNRNEMRRRRKLEQRLRALDPDKFLPHLALAAMTENEIALAIQEYVASNRKRGRTRAKTKQQSQQQQKQRQEATLSSSNKTAMASQVNTTTATTTTTNSAISTCKLTRQLEPNAMDLAEAQKRRSERAMKAYQTRLQNQRVKEGSLVATNDDEARNPRNTSINMTFQTTRWIKSDDSGSGLSPLEALLQVERDLDDGFLPNLKHVQALREPSRLAGRKQVLLRILSECFGLRGKCIPATATATTTTTTTTTTTPSYDGTALTLTSSSSNGLPTEDDAVTGSADRDDTPFLFATKVPVQRIGEFIVGKLREAAKGEDA